MNACAAGCARGAGAFTAARQVLVLQRRRRPAASVPFPDSTTPTPAPSATTHATMSKLSGDTLKEAVNSEPPAASPTPWATAARIGCRALAPALRRRAAAALPPAAAKRCAAAPTAAPPPSRRAPPLPAGTAFRAVGSHLAPAGAGWRGKAARSGSRSPAVLLEVLVAEGEVNWAAAGSYWSDGVRVSPPPQPSLLGPRRSRGSSRRPLSCRSA